MSSRSFFRAIGGKCAVLYKRSAVPDWSHQITKSYRQEKKILLHNITLGNLEFQHIWPKLLGNVFKTGHFDCKSPQHHDLCKSRNWHLSILRLAFWKCSLSKLRRYPDEEAGLWSDRWGWFRCIAWRCWSGKLCDILYHGQARGYGSTTFLPLLLTSAG